MLLDLRLFMYRKLVSKYNFEHSNNESNDPLYFEMERVTMKKNVLSLNNKTTYTNTTNNMNQRKYQAS